MFETVFLLKLLLNLQELFHFDVCWYYVFGCCWLFLVLVLVLVVCCCFLFVVVFVAAILLHSYDFVIVLVSLLLLLGCFVV